MRVLVADKFEQAGLDGLAAIGCSVTSEPGLGPETLSSAIKAAEAEVLIVRSTKVPAAVIEAAGPTLRLIIRAGAGYDNIDVAAAAAKNIPVCNCPGMNAVAVAELAMGHLIACDRRLADQKSDLRQGKWRKKEYGKARGLKGMTLGVVGVGAIGREVIKRAKAFDMDVVAWSRSMTADEAQRLGVRFGGSSRDELLKMLPACDAVSLHVAAAAETKGMCDTAFFEAMKEGAYFINTARGTLVDEGALAKAAAAKGIRAGVDVYENQPGTPEADFTTPLSELPGASLSHHCGASTDQAQNAVAEETVRIVKTLKESGEAMHRVN